MIRKAASKALILAAVTLASGAMSVNCSKKSDQDDIGSVGLALTLPGGGIVNTVTYSITGGTLTTPLTGSIDVSAPGTTQATALVSGLVAGNYTVTMNASTSETPPLQTCAGTAPFTVVAGQTAMANVILQCNRINNRGSVAIAGRLDQCPLITGLSATSLQAQVGGSIGISVVASELDTGDTLTYTWTTNPTGIGTVGAATAMTTFTCTAVGATKISIVVSDGICSDHVTDAIPVNCIANTTAGTAGTGGGTAGTGGGTAGTGGGTAGTGGGGTGGGGTAGTGGGGGTPIDVTMCPFETLPPVALAMSCRSCLTDQGNPATDGCCGITDATGLTLCQAASACMRTGGATGTTCNLGGDVTTCYCGTNQATCDVAGSANGPCIASITAAAGRNVVTGVTDAPTAAQVLARQADPAFALGRAANIQGIAGAFCPAECGF